MATGVDDAVFSALADPTRRRLIGLLGEHPGSNATALAAQLPVSRQAVQKHMSALAAAGLVAAERSGREVHYHLTPAPMSEAVEWMASVGAEWDERLAALGRTLGATS